MPLPHAEVARLYAAHARRVHRWVSRFTRGPDVEEIVHEVFVKVIESIDRFRADASPVTWLYRLTTNHCLNRVRDAGRRADLWRAHVDTLWAPPITAAEQETLASLDQLWRRLDDELVESAWYYFVDGMSHAEIARIVGCSERTVGNRIERVRRLALASSPESPP